MRKKVLVGFFVAIAFICIYVAFENSDMAQSRQDQNDQTAERQLELEQRQMISDYLESNISSDAYKLLADIDGLSTYVRNGKAEISFRVLFDFEIPYVAEMVIPIIQSAVDETGVPLGSLSIQCYAKSNQNGIEDGSMVIWRTHDLISGIFASEPDGYTTPGATIGDLMAYYEDESSVVDRILGRDIPEDTTRVPQNTNDLERFGTLLEPYQGEWKQIKSDWHLIIDGNQICSAYYQNYGDIVVEPMHIYQFDLDDNQELVVTQHSNPKYQYTIGENGNLFTRQITDYTSITNEYEKVSDNTTFPPSK